MHALELLHLAFSGLIYVWNRGSIPP